MQNPNLRRLSPNLHGLRPHFFFNATATPGIYTLSLHDALPISKAIPSLAGVRMASTPTTPLPRVSGKPGAEEHHKRSVAAGIALWVVVVAIGLGAPALYAYKKGLLFFAHAAPGDSTSAVARDTLAQRLL